MNKLVPSLRFVAASITTLAAFSILFVPHTYAKTTKLEYTGWIPYWAGTKAINDANAHLSTFTEINPFGYTVKSDGTLHDAMNVNSSSWQTLFKNADKKGVEVIPTVMWSDGAAIDATLSSQSKRAAHIKSITSTVKQNGFDGIDIDYEAKLAETRDDYSAFLKELSVALKKDNRRAQLHCTIEARMPLKARYSGTPPANIEYANDLKGINRYCDRVRIMTYDQMTADIQLSAANRNTIYTPISDPVWVEKVVKYMGKDIDLKKMSVGVATYGYIYQAMSKPDGSGFTYTKVEAFNPGYGVQTAKEYGITPTRSAAGEMAFSYVPKESSSALPTNNYLSDLAPSDTPSANLASAGALAYSKKTGRQAPVQYLTWSDSGAIKDKVTLARKLGVKGIAIFKIDGGEDSGMWSVLK